MARERFGRRGRHAGSDGWGDYGPGEEDQEDHGAEAERDEGGGGPGDRGRDEEDDDEAPRPPSLADLLSAASPTLADRLATASRRNLQERLIPQPTRADRLRADVTARWPGVRDAL